MKYGFNRYTALIALAVFLTACGGGGGSPTTPNFLVGGTVSGLNGSVVLQNNGGDDLTVSASGLFSFFAAVADGNPYHVTIRTQPDGQRCSVSNASGTVISNVTHVAVHCVSRRGWISSGSAVDRPQQALADRRTSH